MAKNCNESASTKVITLRQVNNLTKLLDKFNASLRKYMNVSGNMRLPDIDSNIHHGFVHTYRYNVEDTWDGGYKVTIIDPDDMMEIVLDQISFREFKSDNLAYHNRRLDAAWEEVDKTIWVPLNKTQNTK